MPNTAPIPTRPWEKLMRQNMDGISWHEIRRQLYAVLRSKRLPGSRYESIAKDAWKRYDEDKERTVEIAVLVKSLWIRVVMEDTK